ARHYSAADLVYRVLVTACTSRRGCHRASSCRCSCSCHSRCRSNRRSRCTTWRRGWRCRRRSARCQDIALTAGSRLTRTVAEVLIKGRVVLLYSSRSRCVAVSYCAVDDIEARLSLIQPQLEPGIAAPREILCPPFNVEDAVGSSPTYRCEYAKPAVDQIQVVPIRVDRVVVSRPRQALVGEGRIGGRKLRIAVRRQIDAGKALIVQRVREGQRDGDHRVVPMIASVGCAWHNRATDLTYRVMV